MAGWICGRCHSENSFQTTICNVCGACMTQDYLDAQRFIVKLQKRFADKENRSERVVFSAAVLRTARIFIIIALLTAVGSTAGTLWRTPAAWTGTGGSAALSSVLYQTIRSQYETRRIQAEESMEYILRRLESEITGSDVMTVPVEQSVFTRLAGKKEILTDSMNRLRKTGYDVRENGLTAIKESADGVIRRAGENRKKAAALLLQKSRMLDQLRQLDIKAIDWKRWLGGFTRIFRDNGNPEEAGPGMDFADDSKKEQTRERKVPEISAPDFETERLS